MVRPSVVGGTTSLVHVSGASLSGFLGEDQVGTRDSQKIICVVCTLAPPETLLRSGLVAHSGRIDSGQLTVPVVSTIISY